LLTDVKQRLTLLDNRLTDVEQLTGEVTPIVEQSLTDVQQCLQPAVSELPPGDLALPQWNVYLLHPRGTVERIAGPFPTELEAEAERDSQMSFGLFPKSKGYRFECREEPQGIVVGQQEEPVSESEIAQSDLPRSVNVDEALAASSDLEGLRLQQVCEHYGISFKNFSRNRKLKDQSVLEYLAEQTGKRWVQRGKRYYQL